MSKRKEKSITLNIRGRDWKFSLISPVKFDKLHNGDDLKRTGVTIIPSYEVHFKEWSVVDIRHEICHILYAMNRGETSDPTPDQVEETMCQLIAYHYSDIGVWVDRIAERFFAEE
jgi:hypothetical protein